MLKVRKLLESINHAIAGIIYSITTQRNMKIHATVAIAALLLGLWADLSRMELLMLLFAVVLVLITEMLNTAIEAVVDIASPGFHQLAKIAKNVAAGAVLLAALNSVIVGFLLFFDKANPLALFVLLHVKRSPVHITLTIFLVLSLLLLLLKSYRPIPGILTGMPSAISALAFALSTAISFITENLFVASLSFFIAFLVAHSRLEARCHTFYEIVAGAVLGSLITVIIFQLYQ
jgi:diacylglycerol kinase (ATP)